MSNPAHKPTGRSWLPHRRPYFIVWPLLLLGILISSLFSLAKTAVVRAAPPDCADNSWSVATEAELNAAIACFNGKTIAGGYAITLTQNISLTAATATISNTTGSAVLVIDGSQVTLDGQDSPGVRPVDVAAGTHVTLQNVTITGGRTLPTALSPDDSGGGIRNAGVLTMSQVTVFDNTADFGGGIANRGVSAQLTVADSTVTQNEAIEGGGIDNPGTLILNRSTVSHNSADSGGGVVNFGIFTATQSTISYNSAQSGGGIDNLGTVAATNATISHNDAQASGGGILNGGILSVTHTTVIQNSAQLGGGIRNESEAFASNTIVANSQGDDNCSADPITDHGYNITSDSSCSFTRTTSLINIDPLLGSLQDNGGATLTHALLSGSPALDAGGSSVATDQRGVARPQGSNPDIGAVEMESYLLSVVKNGTGQGTVTGTPGGINCGGNCSASFIDDTTVTLTASAEIGSTFSGWSGADCSGTGSCVVTMDGAKSVTATFAINQYALTTATSGTGSGSVNRSPDQPLYDHGTVVTLTATADLGSTFSGWSGSGCSGTGNCVVTMDGAKSVTATFAINQYALTISADGTGSGSITRSPDQPLYDHGTVVTLTATADGSSTFTGWSGDAEGFTNPIIVTMEAARQITGTFTLGTNVLAVAKGGSGSGRVTSTPAGIACGLTCASDFDSGTVVTLTAAADSSSNFFGWFGAGCSGTGSCIVTMDEAKNVTATFVLKKYALTTATNGNGSGTVARSPDQSLYDHGTVVTLTAAADVGSTFTGWSGAGCSGTGTCVVTMDEAKAVTATFVLKQYALTTVTNGNGSGAVTRSPDSPLYNHGTVVTLTATADHGSTFTGWSGAGCSGTGNCIVTMNGAKSVTATFIRYVLYLPLLQNPP